MNITLQKPQVTLFEVPFLSLVNYRRIQEIANQVD